MYRGGKYANLSVQPIIGFLIPTQWGVVVHLFRLVNLISYASRKDQRNEYEQKWALQLSSKSQLCIVWLDESDHFCKFCFRKAFKFINSIKRCSSCCFSLFLDPAKQDQRINYALTNCKSASSSSIPIIPFDRYSGHAQSDLYYTINEAI